MLLPYEMSTQRTTPNTLPQKHRGDGKLSVYECFLILFNNCSQIAAYSFCHSIIFGIEYHIQNIL